MEYSANRQQILYADVEIDLESSDCKEKTYVSNIVALGAGTIKIL